MDITQFVMAYGVEQDRLSPPAADGGKTPPPSPAARCWEPTPCPSPGRIESPARRWVFPPCSRRRFVV